MRKRFTSLLLAALCAAGCLSAAAPWAEAGSSAAELRAYALANWSRPLLEEYEPVAGGAAFGAVRNGRRHAAVDLVVEDGAGTPVYAMESGVVVEYCHEFYCGTSAVAVRHADGSVLRYCELSTPLRNGDAVEQGQQIGKLIPNYSTDEAMLHLELYMGTRTGGLTLEGNGSYDYIADAYYVRRADLLDPTFLLGVTRFRGEHEHLWRGDGVCAVCERDWTEVEDLAKHIGGFVDVTVDDYCADAVLWALENGVSSGASALFFGTDEDCTRAQAVTLLWRAAGAPEIEIGNPFADVEESDYCYDAARWAYETGITLGAGGGLFDPDGSVTRAQVLLFLWRAAGAPETDGEHDFTDVAEDAAYRDAVAWAAANGVAGGTGDNTFDPANNCTRGQFITFLYRAGSLAPAAGAKAAETAGEVELYDE